MPGEIRDLRPDDAATLARLHANAVATSAWGKQAFYDSLQQPGAIGLALEEGTTLQGFILASIVLGEAEILQISVAPEFRRQGGARLLVDTLIDRLDERQVERVMLEVSATNTAARTLYKAVGFKQYGVRKNYYPGVANSREDAILMSRTIAGHTSRDL